MAVTARRQTVVVTAVPRGFTPDGTGVLVGVHVSPRLSYAGPAGSARLAHFPDWLEWPRHDLGWRASFDGGTNWQVPTAVTDVGDLDLWHGTFHPETRVDSWTGKPGVKPEVLGYSWRTLADGLAAVYGTDRIGDSPMGAAVKQALATPEKPGRTPTADVRRAMSEFLEFWRPTERLSNPVPGELDPDFHERLSLIADHGPLMERLRQVVVLTFPAPSNVTRVTLRMNWTPSADVPATVRSPLTSAVYRRTGDLLFAPKRRSPDSSAHDERLRWLLNTDRFGIYDLDVDATTGQVVSVGSGDDGAEQTPPAPRSAGLTLVQHGRMTEVDGQLAAAHAAATKLADKAAAVPTVFAEELIAGHHVQVQREGDPTWYGIGHRLVSYSGVTPDGDPVGFRATDEAAVTLAAREQKAGDPDTLLVSDVVTRWDGWSIAVERPGRMLLQPDANTNALTEKQQAPQTWLTMHAAVPEKAADGSEGRLPVLRYGASYAVRARAVDVCGAAPTWSGAPTSPPARFHRWDPVAAPLVLPPPALTAGETARTLVVRSDPRTGESFPATSVRTLVPPRVAVEIGLQHGVFDDEDGRPDRSRWGQIASLDDQWPPSTGPATPSRTAPSPAAVATTRTPTSPPSSTAPTSPPPSTTSPSTTSPSTTSPSTTPSPTTSPTSTPTTPPPDPTALPVRWLPDPMTTAVNLSMVGLGTRDASFLPPGSSATGFEKIGSWWSVALQLRGLSPGALATLGQVEQRTGQRVVRVSLPPADTRTLSLRAQPHSSLLPGHGLVSLLPGTDGANAAAVAAGAVPVLTPSIELTLLHAVRKPLTDPTIMDVDVDRLAGEKDPRITATVSYEQKSTGRVALIASWEEPVDDGPAPKGSAGDVPPGTRTVPRSVVFEREVEPVGENRVSVDQLRVAFPDLRRRDVRFRAVATSRFVAEFRAGLPGFSGGSTATDRYLDLPADVDVESLLLSRQSAALTRGVDYLIAEHPDTGRRTVLVPAGKSSDGIVIEGVRGSVLAESPQTAVVAIPSAVRPAPPKPVYAVPAFELTPGDLDGDGVAVAERGGSRLRIWLDRPWWSSGVGERLAVITSLEKWTLDPQDGDRLSKLVTTYGGDPAVRFGTAPIRTQDVVTGTFRDRLRIDEDLPANIQGKAYLNARVHDVAYDADRDLYYAEVQFATQPAGTFVRLAIARYQELTAPTALGQQPVQLSRIVTMDPVRLLPPRRARVTRTDSGISAMVSGPVHLGPDAQHPVILRVSVQRKGTGGPDVGWETIASAQRNVGETFPEVQVAVPNVSGELRVLLEELEQWQAVDKAGVKVATAAYEAKPADARAAIADLRGLRPVWIATTPMPES